MPRNVSGKTNLHPRAIEARERQAAREEQQARETEQRQQHDLIQHDISASKKTQRLLAKQDKAREAAEKREHKKNLQEADDLMCASQPKGKFAKAQAAEQARASRREYVQRREHDQAAEAKAHEMKQEKILGDTRRFLDIENTNHLAGDELQKDIEQYGAGNVIHASGLDAAVKGLSLLNVSANDIQSDKWPEKRRKQAYKRFETRRIPELREENPSLKLSQLKQRCFDEFQHSPENPMNQPATGPDQQ